MRSQKFRSLDKPDLRYGNSVQNLASTIPNLPRRSERVRSFVCVGFSPLFNLFKGTYRLKSRVLSVVASSTSIGLAHQNRYVKKFRLLAENGHDIDCLTWARRYLKEHSAAMLAGKESPVEKIMKLITQELRTPESKGKNH